MIHIRTHSWPSVSSLFELILVGRPDTIHVMMITEGDIKMSPTPNMSLESDRSEMLKQVTLGTQNAIHLSN